MALTAPLMLLMPLLASAQMYAPPTNVTGLGGNVGTGYYPLEFYYADKNATIHNKADFRGYNSTPPITFQWRNGETNSTDTWSLDIRYSRVTVQDNEGNTTVGNTVFALDFPEEQWPLNDTDWQLCASLVLDNFPASISSKAGSNASDSSCAPYLGETCAEAMRQAYINAMVQSPNQCPGLPLFTDVKGCEDVTKAFGGSQGVGTFIISNTTSPDIIDYRRNNTYVNVDTGAMYTFDELPFQGVESGQGFAYKTRVLAHNQRDTDALSLAESRKLQMMAFQIVPSVNFRANSTGGYGYYINPRLVCGRAEVATSGMVRLRTPVVMLAVALMAAVFPSLG